MNLLEILLRWIEGQYVNGSYLKEFEEKFSKFTGVKYCVGVRSWTDMNFSWR